MYLSDLLLRVLHHHSFNHRRPRGSGRTLAGYCSPLYPPQPLIITGSAHPVALCRLLGCPQASSRLPYPGLLGLERYNHFRTRQSPATFEERPLWCTNFSSHHARSTFCAALVLRGKKGREGGGSLCVMGGWIPVSRPSSGVSLCHSPSGRSCRRLSLTPLPCGTWYGFTVSLEPSFQCPVSILRQSAALLQRFYGSPLSLWSRNGVKGDGASLSLSLFSLPTLIDTLRLPAGRFGESVSLSCLSGEQ